jgi:hypothetical protein
MCIFTGSVREVGGTKIFVGDVGDGKHGCVYSMTAKIDKPVAMVLPVPVAEQKDDAVEFVNLEGCEDFFVDLDECWYSKSRGRGMLSFGGPACAGEMLKVHDVGQYIASFVPSLAYFAKLSPEFRLSSNAVKSFRNYSGWGYAVFQLKESSKEADFHPMGFKYTPKDKDVLFFPTVHIHDGESYHDRSDYDHTLYAQPDVASEHNYWDPSDCFPPKHLADKAKGFLSHERGLFKIRVYGKKPNLDYVLTTEWRSDPHPQTRSPV